jgi:biotin carboxyl carrier protein
MNASPDVPQSWISRNATLIAGVVAILCILIPYLFWKDTWFGQPLTDDQVSQNLADHEHPRKAQHALAQISERIGRGQQDVKKWYPQIVALADHPLDEMRTTVAWLMGQDNEAPEFHEALEGLVQDPNPLVRRNAALSLTRFGDRTGHEEILAMLRPYTVASPYPGEFTNRLQPGDMADAGTLLARVAVPGEAEPKELRSPVPGEVRKRLVEDGSTVYSGQDVFVLGPDPNHSFEALRALYLIGTAADLEDVNRFLRPSGDLPSNVVEQARLTAEGIRGRGEP